MSYEDYPIEETHSRDEDDEDERESEVDTIYVPEENTGCIY